MGDLRSVNKILDTAAANVETPDKNDWSPLCIAIYNGHQSIIIKQFNHKPLLNNLLLILVIVRRLLEQNANIDVRESLFGWTPLLIAIWMGNEVIVLLLIEQGASLATKDKNGRNALFIATERSHIELIDMILKRDPSQINEVDNFGRTALYIAVQLGEKKVVTKLCNCKANLEIADQDGRKPLFMAKKLGYEEIADLLITAGANTENLTIDYSEGYGEAVFPCQGKFIALVEKPAGIKVFAFCEFGDKIWAGCNEGSILIYDMISRQKILFHDKIQNKMIHHIISIDNTSVWSLCGNQEIWIWTWNQNFITTNNPTDIITNSYKINEGLEINSITKNGNEIVGATSKNSILIWNLLNPKSPSTKIQLEIGLIKLSDYQNSVTGILFHNGKLFVSIFRYIFCYDPSNRYAFKGYFEGHLDIITSMVTVDKHIWSSSRDNTIRVWNIETRDCIKCLSEAGGGQVLCLCKTRDEQIISSGTDGFLRSWNTKQLCWKRTFKAKHEKLNIPTMFWDSNSRLWVSSFDETVSIWK